MPRYIDIQHHVSLDEYAADPSLIPAIEDLRVEAAASVPRLKGRTVWMISSTEHGGGVAEMLPPIVSLLRDLGLHIEWVVMDADDPDFFRLTKRIHNLIHGNGTPGFSEDDRALYDAVSRQNADWMREHVQPDDVVVAHDPQPLGVGALLAEEVGCTTIWRCHIGLADKSRQTSSAWRFLKPYALPYDRAVFSAPEYIPSYLAGVSTVISPAIDPLSYKNRDLRLYKLAGILKNAALTRNVGPVVTPQYEHPAMRLQRDGSWAPADASGDIGLLNRPIIAQISRWDRLKGFGPLMKGFARMKRDRGQAGVQDEKHRRSLEAARLVMAGPDPDSIQDDPEGLEVLEELRQDFLALPDAVAEDVVVLTLPMASRKLNALIVNALQRCAMIVAQNSLREGFGLTATEGMWKRAAVMGTHATGLRAQIRDGIDGRLVVDATDDREIAATLADMLGDSDRREAWGLSAQRRVYHEFLIFVQLRRWLELAAMDGP